MQTDPAATTKLCPFCAEEIKPEAVVCRFCQRDLRPGAEQPALKVEQTTSTLTVIGSVLLVLLLIIWIYSLLNTPVS